MPGSRRHSGGGRGYGSRPLKAAGRMPATCPSTGAVKGNRSHSREIELVGPCSRTPRTSAGRPSTRPWRQLWRNRNGTGARCEHEAAGQRQGGGRVGL
jgi:hypothetical protein